MGVCDLESVVSLGGGCSFESIDASMGKVPTAQYPVGLTHTHTHTHTPYT